MNRRLIQPSWRIAAVNRALNSMSTHLRVSSWLVVAALAGAACGTAPTAPTPSAGAPAALPSGPTLTVTVRSGAEGFPPIAGATVRTSDASQRTDAAGRAAFVTAVAADVQFEVSAPGFVPWVSRADLGTTATLWPLLDGTTPAWVFQTSYVSNNFAEYLARPTEDVRIDMQGEFNAFSATWSRAAEAVTSAIVSGNPAAPRVLAVRDEPGALRMTYNDGPCPRAPCLAVLRTRVTDPTYALEMVSSLVGFELGRGRQVLPALSSAGTGLASAEWLALRMRFFRAPGTLWVADAERDDEVIDGGVVRRR